MKWIGLLLIALTVFLAGCDDSSTTAGPPITLNPKEPGTDIIYKYLETSSLQEDALRGMSMEVTLDGRLPKLKKEGTMNALRRISSLGKITYKVLGFSGDNTVKKEVIARYLTAETESKDKEESSIAIVPQNYKFKYKGLREQDDQQIHVFELKPRRKRVGLFKGELWIDSETFMPVREAGEFVKNPSIFLKKVQFVRDYEILNGVAVPKRIESLVETRVVGRAELDIEFENLRKLEAEDEVAEARTIR